MKFIVFLSVLCLSAAAVSAAGGVKTNRNLIEPKEKIEIISNMQLDNEGILEEEGVCACSADDDCDNIEGGICVCEARTASIEIYDFLSGCLLDYSRGINFNDECGTGMPDNTRRIRGLTRSDKIPKGNRRIKKSRFLKGSKGSKGKGYKNGCDRRRLESCAVEDSGTCWYPKLEVSSSSLTAQIEPTEYPKEEPTKTAATETIIQLAKKAAATSGPTKAPETPDTKAASFAPSSSPTSPPTLTPTTKSPSPAPSTYDSSAPSTEPTRTPTTTPTILHSEEPSFVPTTSPSKAPTDVPTASPTLIHSSSPSSNPTARPSSTPSTNSPTEIPTISPTQLPSASPTTSSPSRLPSKSPSSSPTSDSSASPSISPSTSPTTASPTTSPSRKPSSTPSFVPRDPTSHPTRLPTFEPSGGPTASPSLIPSSSPTSCSAAGEKCDGKTKVCCNSEDRCVSFGSGISSICLPPSVLLNQNAKSIPTHKPSPPSPTTDSSQQAATPSSPVTGCCSWFENECTEPLTNHCQQSESICTGKCKGNWLPIPGMEMKSDPTTVVTTQPTSIPTGSAIASPTSPVIPPCECEDTWSTNDAGCTSTQYGCPNKACDGADYDPWCIIKEPKYCATAREYNGEIWSYCGVTEEDSIETDSIEADGIETDSFIETDSIIEADSFIESNNIQAENIGSAGHTTRHSHNHVDDGITTDRIFADGIDPAGNTARYPRKNDDDNDDDEHASKVSIKMPGFHDAPDAHAPDAENNSKRDKIVEPNDFPPILHVNPDILHSSTSSKKPGH